MPISELHRWLVECDHAHCHEQFVTEGAWPVFPLGWGVYTTCGWGSTDYCKEQTVCPSCAAAARANGHTVKERTT